MTPITSFFFQDHFGYSEIAYLAISVNFKISLSISARKVIGILAEVALNLWVDLENIVILTASSLFIHEHRMSFHLFRSFKCTSFTSVLVFTVHKSCTSLVKFIHECFILFDTIVNGIVSFISIFFFFCLFRATPTACGGSQARGQIGATAAALHNSHSNGGSRPHLRPVPQLTAMPDP